MRLVLAARLSRARDRQTGWDTQDEDARLWATHNGHSIVAVAADRISGRVSPFKRKNLGPWLTDPDLMATYDGILATKIDRLTRKRDWDIRQWAEKHGKKILIAMPELTWPPLPGDTTTPMLWDNLVNIAVAEWEGTSMRYRRMQKSLRDQGYLVGKGLYGYRRIESGSHKTLEPDPVTAPIVREMAARYLDGQSTRQIRDWLTSINAPVPRQPKDRPGNGWTGNAVLRILRNPAIIGRIQSDGRTYARVKPLISTEDFPRIQDAITARQKNHDNTARDTALLTGIIRCDRGHPMYRIKAKPRPNSPSAWYYCNSQFCPKGTRLLVPVTEIHDAIDEAVRHAGKNVWGDDEPHIITTVIPGDTYGEEKNQVKEEMHKAVEAEDFSQVADLQKELERLNRLPRKPAKITTDLHRKTTGEIWTVIEVWNGLDDTGKRQWLLARRPSGWLENQSPDKRGAKVHVLGPRDPDTGVFPVDIDLGDATESFEALRRL